LTTDLCRDLPGSGVSKIQESYGKIFPVPERVLNARLFLAFVLVFEFICFL